MTTRDPRGIRNHNPGNIEYDGTAWQGLDDPPSDGRFCRFKAPSWGIRAIARVLLSYQDRHGINTVAGMIARWAPPVENDTGAYAAHVAKSVGVAPADPINVHDHAVMRPLVEAFIRHENGVQPYTDAQIDKGLVLAGIEPAAKSLASSRTVQGGQVAAGATVLGAVAENVDAVKEALAGLVPFMPALKWGLVALTILSIGYMIWARIDDRRRLAR